MNSTMWLLVKPKIRHIVALAIFFLLMLPALYAVVINSDSYKDAYQFIVSDPHVAVEVGEVKQASFEFWHGFEFSSFGTGGHADYSFRVTTNRGTYSIEIHLQMISSIWKVTAASIRSSDGTLKHITI